MTNLVETVLKDDNIVGLFAWCEGCDSRHYIPIVAASDGVKWEWNQQLDIPTVSPSILIYEYEGHHPRCHSFIISGEWQYLSDCTHQYLNSTRKLLPVDQWPVDAFTNV